MAMAGLSCALDARSLALRHIHKASVVQDHAQRLRLGRDDARFPPPGCSGAATLGRGGSMRTAARRFLALVSDVAVEEDVADTAGVELGNGWGEFAERVSGEWDGYGAEFTAKGEAVELPSAVVPEAFKEWGVEIHDWLTQCPALAEAGPVDLWYKVIRLLPTVGCEADAATQYSLERRSVEEDAALFFAFQRNGSYTAVWPGISLLTAGIGCSAKVVVRNRDVADAWELEHCFVEEGTDRVRTRILQQFCGWTEEAESRRLPVLKAVTIYVERWDGPFRNGESLGSCGTKGSAFATSARLDASALQGNWSGETLSAGTTTAGSNVSSRVKELRAVKMEQVSRDLEGVVTLPKGVWFRINAFDEAGYFVEAGWVSQQEKAFVSRCEFSSQGHLKAVHTRKEQREC